MDLGLLIFIFTLAALLVNSLFLRQRGYVRRMKPQSQVKIVKPGSYTAKRAPAKRAPIRRRAAKKRYSGFWLLLTEKIVLIVITFIVLGAALFIILKGDYPPATDKWAFGAIGTVLGYWLKR